MFFDPRLSNEVHDTTVPIDSSQINITIRRDCVILSIFDLHDCHVECAAAQVINEHTLLCRRSAFGRQKTLLDTVTDSGRGWLIDDVQYLQACQLAGILSCFATRFIEERRHCDHGLLQFAQLQFSIFLELGKDQSLQNLWWQLCPANRISEELFTHITFSKHGEAFWLFNSCLDCLHADHGVPAIKENDTGR